MSLKAHTATKSLMPLTEDALWPFRDIGIRTPLSDLHGTAPAWSYDYLLGLQRAECGALMVPLDPSSLLSGPCQRLFVAERLKLPLKWWLHFAWGTVSLRVQRLAASVLTSTNRTAVSLVHDF